MKDLGKIPKQPRINFSKNTYSKYEYLFIYYVLPDTKVITFLYIYFVYCANIFCKTYFPLFSDLLYFYKSLLFRYRSRCICIRILRPVWKNFLYNYLAFRNNKQKTAYMKKITFHMEFYIQG